MRASPHLCGLEASKRDPTPQAGLGHSHGRRHSVCHPAQWDELDLGSSQAVFSTYDAVLTVATARAEEPTLSSGLCLPPSPSLIPRNVLFLVRLLRWDCETQARGPQPPHHPRSVARTRPAMQQAVLKEFYSPGLHPGLREPLVRRPRPASLALCPPHQPSRLQPTPQAQVHCPEPAHIAPGPA